jgi:phage terminase large subunit GpA-like protein
MIESLNIIRTNIAQNILSNSVALFVPPERMTVSECAERNRILPTTSAFAGRWQTMSFQKDLMDCFNDSKIERVIIESGTQLGKTEVLLNIIAWIVLNDPSSILVVYPREQDVRNFSKQRLGRMIELSPALKERFEKVDKSDTQNVNTRSFRGGCIYMAHAGSPASLAMNPCKYIIMDEVDKYDFEVGDEGDPVKLAEARSDNFELTGRKIIMTCSPTTSLSRIHAEFMKGDQRYFHIPCKECGEYFKVNFNTDVFWDKDETVTPHKHHPETARIICPHCKAEMGEKERLWSITKGKYIPYAETVNCASFNIPSFYSPIRRLSTIVKDFLSAKESATLLKTFINTKLAEIHTVAGESLDNSILYNRREKYIAQVPAKCGILISAADVQIDRIEVGVWGFGKEDELWLIDYAVLPGDPYKPDVWKSLDEFRNNTYTHESGAKIRIRLLAVDAGNWAKEVLEFCAKSSHNCIPIRGSNRTQLALCQKSKDATYPVYWIATDIAKDIIFSRFKVTEPGPRYIHIPEWATQDICAQLTNEERKEYKRAGITSTHWMPKGSSLRVESLDILVYAPEFVKRVVA